MFFLCVCGGGGVKKFSFFDWLNINLKAPEKNTYENVVCLSHLLHTFANLIIDLFKHRSKQCGPRSDCSCKMLL